MREEREAARDAAPGAERPRAGVQELGVLGVHARSVERPGSEKEAQSLLALAFRERKTVLPCGGGTALAAGVLPEAVDIALDTTALNRVLAFDPQNLNIALLAGVTVGAVNEYLASQGKGFFLPLDPPWPERATIGGVYASNASGPSRLRYGTVRDQALGVRGADARGREIGFGGKTVKNVSGYDLTKFFVGSAGSLCLITSISFRVMPLPEVSSLCRVGFEDVGALGLFLSRLRASVLIPSAVVVTGPEGEPGDRCPSLLRGLVSFEGHMDAVARQNRDLLRLAAECGGSGQAEEGREVAVKALRAAIGPAGSALYTLCLKVSVPLAEGPRAYAALRSLAAECGAKRCKVVLYAGNGVLTVDADGLAPEGTDRLVGGAKELAHAAGGHVAPIRAHRLVLSAWGPRLDPTLQRLVLQPIKERLDPTSVFPPIA
ncbi:MAG: FAD-binding oxidoreductase [Deltaproteobacteria bacterium]|nr:FAD-binding oxidoreductase [Deltaproteobacteria bacterium]